MLKTKQVILMAVIFILFLPVLALAGTVDLPKTGQTTCYDSGGTVIPCADKGQGGGIQAGVPRPSQRFTVSGDCVTDNLTGLMWTRNANLIGYSETWYEARIYVWNLTLCGYSHWRLPTEKELKSLINAEVPDSATWLNTQGFINVKSDYDYDCYWSHTTTVDNHYVLVVNMSHGMTDYIQGPFGVGIQHHCYVWPVRGNN
jgi:hypothetical protein